MNINIQRSGVGPKSRKIDEARKDGFNMAMLCAAAVLSIRPFVRVSGTKGAALANMGFLLFLCVLVTGTAFAVIRKRKNGCSSDR